MTTIHDFERNGLYGVNVLRRLSSGRKVHPRKQQRCRDRSSEVAWLRAVEWFIFLHECEAHSAIGVRANAGLRSPLCRLPILDEKRATTPTELSLFTTPSASNVPCFSVSRPMPSFSRTSRLSSSSSSEGFSSFDGRSSRGFTFPSRSTEPRSNSWAGSAR